MVLLKKILHVIQVFILAVPLSLLFPPNIAILIWYRSFLCFFLSHHFPLFLSFVDSGISVSSHNPAAPQIFGNVLLMFVCVSNNSLFPFNIFIFFEPAWDEFPNLISRGALISLKSFLTSSQIFFSSMIHTIHFRNRPDIFTNVLG